MRWIACLDNCLFSITVKCNILAFWLVENPINAFFKAWLLSKAGNQATFAVMASNHGTSYGKISVDSEDFTSSPALLNHLEWEKRDTIALDCNLSKKWPRYTRLLHIVNNGVHCRALVELCSARLTAFFSWSCEIVHEITKGGTKVRLNFIVLAESVFNLFVNSSLHGLF